MSRQHLDASVGVFGYAFGAILADRWLVFQREIREIHCLRNTEIRLENTREIQKSGCTIANVVSRGFRGYRTLWGKGRPTLRNIALTTSAIWGKYTFYEIQKYGLKIREIRVHHRKRCVQRFPWVKTLWGSGRPTLCNIPLTRFGGNREIRLENTRNTKIRVHHRKRCVQRFSWV